MEQNSLILVVNNLSQREQTREIFGQTERKMFTRIAAIKAENVSSDTGQPFRQFPIKFYCSTHLITLTSSILWKFTIDWKLKFFHNAFSLFSLAKFVSNDCCSSCQILLVSSCNVRDVDVCKSSSVLYNWNSLRVCEVGGFLLRYLELLVPRFGNYQSDHQSDGTELQQSDLTTWSSLFSYLLF